MYDETICSKGTRTFSLTDQSTAIGTLQDGKDCKIHLDSGTTKSFLSKQHYLRNKSLHGLPKSSSKAKVIQVGNGASFSILFIIPIIIMIPGYISEIDTIVSKILDNVDLVLGVKNRLRHERVKIQVIHYLSASIPCTLRNGETKYTKYQD